MIQLTFEGGTRLRFDFTFFALGAVLLCVDRSGYALLGLAACLLHEGGHIFVMWKRGDSPRTVTFRGGGIAVSDRNGGILPPASVLVAGSAANFLAFSLTALFADGLSVYVGLFAVMNLVIGVFNLLPVGTLDGKFLLQIALLRVLPCDKADRILAVTEAVTAAALVVFAAWCFSNVGFNWSVLAVGLYLLICWCPSRTGK
ncbi:MAG: hypothetical protein LBN40_06140 [Oscillospiraceae bacterium]|nr:hypothetical protein [Oscillospiraceae bacterium]